MVDTVTNIEYIILISDGGFETRSVSVTPRMNVDGTLYTREPLE